jgi:type VI secretion system secreted protein VgrG
MTSQITISSDKCKSALFSSMTADERLGRMFSYYVQFESEDANIDLSGLLGSSMTVKLETSDGYQRYFNGIVCEAAQTGVETVNNLVYAQYGVRLVPKPWLLGQKVDCRIYTNMTTPDIIKSVLSDAGYSDIKLSLSADYTAREYCVQYREDCLNFISRLMEQEGIYYFFTHDQTTHTMVLADGVSAHSVNKDFGRVPYLNSTDSVLRKQSTITTWSSSRGLDAAKYQLTDYDPMAPKTSLLSTGTSDGHGTAGSSNGLVAFDYPGAHVVARVGEQYAQVRAEALSVARSHYTGTTGACSIEIGGLFTLCDYPRQALNREYLIIGTTIHLTGGGHASGSNNDAPSFQCSFDAIESSQTYRSLPIAVKPSVVGLQTAVVTGSDTDEDIAVDQYGRVQVTFHWNKPDKPNAKSSCPVRIASPWAGKGWGAVSIPRVGQEVVISFLEGDPDRPLIIGSVYNGDNTVPYSLPSNKTQSGIKSRSLNGGTADFNELRFEDKQGSEDFFMHAQKDMHEEVENDHVVAIDHDETITIKNDQTLTVQHDRNHTVSNNDTLNVSQNGSTTIGQSFKLSAGTQIELVSGASSIILKSSGEIQITGVNITITGNSSVSVEGQVQVGIKAGATMDIGAGASMKVHSDAMMDVEGGAMTTVKGAMLTASGDGMTQVSGGIIMIG